MQNRTPRGAEEHRIFTACYQSVSIHGFFTRARRRPCRLPRMSNPRLSSALKRKSAPQRAAEAVIAFVKGIGKFLGRDPLNTLLLVATIGLVITFFSLLGSLNAQDSGTRTGLSEVYRLANQGKLQEATLLDRDHRVQAITTTGQEIFADYPSSDAATQQLTQALQRNRVAWTVEPQANKPLRATVAQFLLPILILVCLFAFFTRLSQSSDSGGIASFSNFAGRGRKKKKGGKAPVTFASVAGAPEALVELKEIRDYLADPEKYMKFGAAAPKGVLLVGPPGTGKTLLAKATAGEADAAFFTASGAEFVESLVGVGAARVRDLFAKARKAAPAIIFIDELDAAGRKRGAGIGQGNDEREQTLNQMLVEMDGFGGDAGIIVMGATNRPDILDPALLRPGRFDRQVVVDVPDVHGRLEILNLHARGRHMAANVDLNEIARMCPGFSGAELANLMNEAALLTVREGRSHIDQATLEEAIDRVVAGPAKKHILSDDERWLIATHEAGHAVATRALGQVTAVQKLSIVARGRQLGTAAEMLADKDSVMQSRTDLERQLASIMAGVAAELIAFGEESTGNSDDLHAATNLAKQMVTSYGMSPRLGHVTIGEPAGEVFLGASLQDLGSTGPKALDIIDDETERFVREAEARADYVLRMNWSVVDQTARALVEQETLSGMALEAMLGPVTVVPLASIPLPSDADSERAEAAH
jgi:cell division protease FtsH